MSHLAKLCVILFVYYFFHVIDHEE